MFFISYRSEVPLEARNAIHIERPTTDRLTQCLIDVTRYIDDLGYEAIQDWNFTGISNHDAVKDSRIEGISKQSAQNAGWSEDGAPYAFIHYETLKECIWAGEDICRVLNKKGYFAVTLADLEPDSYMTIGKLGCHMPDLCANAPYAAVAGLGALGKSGMLVRPYCGPGLRYVFVITDAPLTASEKIKGDFCGESCTECAKACPMNALSEEIYEDITIRDGEVYRVMKRDETLCMRARSLALCEGAGSDRLDRDVPDMEVSEVVTDEKIEEALSKKDKIQTLCYQCPNFTDIIVERCLQVCPVVKKLNKN